MDDTTNASRKEATLEEIRQRCLHWVDESSGRRVVAGSAYNRLFLRRVSVRLTRQFLRLGISANTATVLMMLAGILGIVCCVPHLIVATVAGAIAFFLFDVLDAVDGEIARWNVASSTRGLFLDKVAHLLVGYPSLGLPAVHYYAMHHDDLYLALAAVAIISGVMGCTLRETFFRINAETARDDASAESIVSPHLPPSPTLFLNFCTLLKSAPLISFPITKTRVVHILTICVIFAAYLELEMPLVCLAWFYAGYGVLRLSLEIPYFYHARVIDVRHEKRVDNYRWPI